MLLCEKNFVHDIALKILFHFVKMLGKLINKKVNIIKCIKTVKFIRAITIGN